VKKTDFFPKFHIAIPFDRVIIESVLLNGNFGDWATPKGPTAGLFFALHVNL
jgi:hypothetical protein